MPETVGLTWNRHRNFCASQSKVSFLLAINFVPRVRFYSVFIILGRLGHEWRGWRYYCSVVVFFLLLVLVWCFRAYSLIGIIFAICSVFIVFFFVCSYLFWSLCNFYNIVTTVFLCGLFVYLFVCLYVCWLFLCFLIFFVCLLFCLFTYLLFYP